METEEGSIEMDVKPDFKAPLDDQSDSDTGKDTIKASSEKEYIRGAAEDSDGIKQTDAIVTASTVTPSPTRRGVRFWLLIFSILITTFVSALDLCSLPTILPTS